MPMKNGVIRDLGEQPIAKIMERYSLKPNDLVSASTEQITHKMVARAMKGRLLTAHVQAKILHAMNKASGRKFSIKDLFNY